MSEHRLKDGLSLIRGLSELGKVLSYHVEKEYPVEEVEHGSPPAVDVAWFRDRNQRFPLMIFEVESKATNAIASNPLKVFSQETKKFEKPLFFFQIIGSGGSQSSYVKNLEQQYGKFNYRIYRIGQHEGNQLLRDILSQHRRIRSDFDFDKLFRFLSSDDWRKIASAPLVLSYAFSLGLSPELKLPAYVHLFREFPQLKLDFIETIKEEQEAKWKSLYRLPSYIGKEWGAFPLCALMIYLCNSEEEAGQWNQYLIDWNNNTSYLPMISPSFGQSWDYDQLLLGAAAPLITLCTAVAGSRVKFHIEMCRILADILEKLHLGWYGYQTAIWLCHISAWCAEYPFFSKARKFINDSGGVSETSLYRPPSWACTESNREELFPSSDICNCPTIEEFRARATDEWCGIRSMSPTELALLVLDDDEFMH